MRDPRRARVCPFPGLSCALSAPTRYTGDMKRMHQPWRLLILLFLVAPISARTKQGRLYNLDTGVQTTLSYTDRGKGRGTITATFAGEALKGEYSTVANGTVGWGAIYGS